MSSLGEEFPKMQAQVRELLMTYKELGPIGIFGATMIEQVLRRADEAVMSGDVVLMTQSYEEMKGCK